MADCLVRSERIVVLACLAFVFCLLKPLYAALYNEVAVLEHGDAYAKNDGCNELAAIDVEFLFHN